MKIRAFRLIAATIAAAAASHVAMADAKVLFTLQEVGTDVVATASGTFDRDLSTLAAPNGASLLQTGTAPFVTALSVGAPGQIEQYVASGPVAFGPGTFTTASSWTGLLAALYPSNVSAVGSSPVFFISSAYVNLQQSDVGVHRSHGWNV